MTAPALHTFRAGSGPTVLMLHGIGSSGTAWGAQMERLGRGFHCIAPDLPGYGESPAAAGAGLDAIVDTVIALLQGQPAHVIGVSFGGLLALALARREPGLVRSLVLADATLGRASLPDAERARWLAHREGLAHELATRSHERAREIAGRHASPEAIDAIAEHMRRARPEGYLAVARAIAQTDASTWLPQIAAPALIVCGEDDQVTGAAMSNTLAHGLPDARLEVIAGAGHAPHIEQPDRFAALVREFLQALPA